MSSFLAGEKEKKKHPGHRRNERKSVLMLHSFPACTHGCNEISSVSIETHFFFSVQYLLPNHIYHITSYWCHFSPRLEGLNLPWKHSQNEKLQSDGGALVAAFTKGFPLEWLIFNHYKSTEV